ncbi:MAG: hypothetical protein H8E14_17325 [Candidatus Marinimicrobia bacterium]|nr:hypothetical protein [Candidatus Neomarinimicrobiota bacterium]
MTNREKREKKYREFTVFGALRFTLYALSGVALYLEAFQLAGVAFIIGAIFGLVRRVYHLWLS